MDNHTTDIIEPQKRGPKRARNLAIAFFVIKLAACVGVVELIFRGSTVSQGIRFLIAWVASFLLGIGIDLAAKMKRSLVVLYENR